MIGHERLTFTQIIMSRGTEIKSSTAKMEKGLNYMYILPWTTLGLNVITCQVTCHSFHATIVCKKVMLLRTVMLENMMFLKGL